jgi:hypothetical protein
MKLPMAMSQLSLCNLRLIDWIVQPYPGLVLCNLTMYWVCWAPNMGMNVRVETTDYMIPPSVKMSPPPVCHAVGILIEAGESIGLCEFSRRGFLVDRGMKFLQPARVKINC